MKVSKSLCECVAGWSRTGNFVKDPKAHTHEE